MNSENADVLLYLSRSDVLTALESVDLLDEVRRALIAHADSRTKLPDEAVMRWHTKAGDEARSLVLQGMINAEEPMAGLKVINANPGNVRSGHVRASGVSMLFDPESARIYALMEGAVISALRTAAVSVLSVEACAAHPPRVVALIGAGELCRAHCRLLLQSIPSIEQIRIHDLDSSRAGAAVEDLVVQGFDAHHFAIASGARSALSGADVVITTTTVTEAYIPWSWIEPGSTLVNVSLDDFEPEVITSAETVIVDDWRLIVDDGRRLLGRMHRDGRFTWHGDKSGYSAHAHIGEVLAGTKPARLSANGVVYVNPFGLAIEDIAVAYAVFRQAVEAGLGTQLAR